MAAGSIPPALDDGDLHRLVDGLLDRQRQSEVLLRLKNRATEAARVAAWREQNDLLKAAFAGLEHDPVPASLRLSPLRLRCIGDERPGDGARPVLAGVAQQSDNGGLARIGVAAGLCLIAAALGASWLVLERAQPARPSSVVLAGSRETDGLLTTPASDGAGDAQFDGERSPPLAEDLPTTTIPDLGPIGFEFTGATPGRAFPKALVFSYQNRAAAHLTLSVARLSDVDPIQAAATGAVAWQRNGRLFLLSGDADRLSAAAAYLQSVAGSAR